MPPETLPPTEPASNSADISRRKLLKMITAAGAGASATVLLSSQWVRPVAAGGQLAPHAQISQPTTHVIVRGDAAQDQQTDGLNASCLISSADPNILMVATVNADLQVPALAPSAPQAVIGSKTASTDASGVASFTFAWDEFDPFPECNTDELEVVFSFASAADGTGTLTVTTPWVQPC